jgi:hypothetical protein
MATQAQTAANRINSESSTGPRTAEGKARCAANATTLGLFAIRDFIRPGEEDEYACLCATLNKSFTPSASSRGTLAAEIVHAAWRLQRCSKVEGSSLPNPRSHGRPHRASHPGVRSIAPAPRLRPGLAVPYGREVHARRHLLGIAVLVRHQFGFGLGGVLARQQFFVQAPFRAPNFFAVLFDFHFV